MEMILQLFAWATASGPQFIASVNAVVMGLIVLFAIIPGEQPEKFFKSCSDFLAKYSKK